MNFNDFPRFWSTYWNPGILIFPWFSWFFLRREFPLRFRGFEVAPWDGPVSCRRSQIVDFPKEYEGFWGTGVCGHAADCNHVVLNPWFSLCRSQNVDFPNEYKGFWATGVCGHSADGNNVIIHAWLPLRRSQNVVFPKEYQGFWAERRFVDTPRHSPMCFSLVLVVSFSKRWFS